MSDDLKRGVDVGRDAATYGFDWPTAEDAMKKVHEEARELDEAIARDDLGHAAEELGDLIFAVTNVARKLGIDPGAALTDALTKFECRFAYVREHIENAEVDVSLGQMEVWWEAAKREENES